MIDNVYLHHHLGLGDHIICNGLVRYILKNNIRNIILPTKKHNVESVKYMYRDLNTVEIDPIINDKCAVKKYKMYKNILRVGFENIKGNNWEKSFYDQLNINYKHRFNSFFIDRDTERENNFIKKFNISKKYAFVCFTNSTSNNNIIPDTDLPIIFLEKITGNLFDWLPIIYSATEVHTIDTSIFQLLKQINLNCRHVFYDISSIDSTRTNYTLDCKKWETIVI
tara:strand:+ start:522 stop:1193 length:672 start_codon:yes stop_codon:yes gene_type:complete